jgi:tetratricopeptide (TPR) repeat protein
MNDNIEKILKKIGAEAVPDDVQKVAQEASNDFSRSLAQTKEPKRLMLLEHIMKNRISKLAAAAVILIGVLVLTSVFVKTNKSVVLAGVLDRVEKAQAYMYTLHITATENTNPERPPIKQYINATIIISNEYGMKSEMDMKWETGNGLDAGKSTTQQMYTLPNRKLAVLLEPESKKYRLMELDDNSIARMKEENKDPRVMLNRILACEYTKKGCTVLNGIEVEGFETADPKIATDKVDHYEDVKVTLWVDVNTWLPVLWEMDMTINEQMHVLCVLSDFQWDIPVVAHDFEPVIPEDYTDSSADGDKAPSLGEEVTPSEGTPAGMDRCERGEVHYFNGEYEQAISELTEAIEINPGLARAYVTRGMVYEDKNEHNLAIADFTVVIEIKPTDARAYVYRGMAYENEGEYDFAIADYSKAIGIDPTIADAYRGRAHAYTIKGEYDKAWKDIHEAQTLGHPVDSRLLEKLRNASGKNE